MNQNHRNFFPLSEAGKGNTARSRAATPLSRVVITGEKRRKASLHRWLHYFRHLKRGGGNERSGPLKVVRKRLAAASSLPFHHSSLEREKASLKGRLHSSIAQLASPLAFLFPLFRYLLYVESIFFTLSSLTHKCGQRAEMRAFIKKYVYTVLIAGQLSFHNHFQRP